MQLNALPADAIAVFSSEIERLTASKRSILLAVSGGPDSLALLLLAHATMPETISAATLNHGLRPEAADEAQFVAQLCQSLAVPHRILRPDTAISGNLQAGARAARYALLEAQAEKTGCEWIATAHHADDQLETMLMRIARGSGVDGLAAIREKQGRIIRPLLPFTKAELENICAACGIVPIRDPSNERDEFDRVAMRQWLGSANHPFDAARAVRSAAAFAEASEALDWMVDRLLPVHVQRSADSITFNPDGLPGELRRRIVSRLLDEIQPGYVPRGLAMDQALAAMEAGDTTMLGDVLCKGGPTWRFRPAPKRRHCTEKR